MIEDKLQLLKDTFKMYLDKYLIERDLLSTLKTINVDSFTGIGTGVDEIVTNYEIAKKIYSRGICNVSTSFEISNQNFEFIELSDDTYLIYGSQDIKSNVDGLLVEQLGLRQSFIFSLINGEFKLTHVHSSLPCYMQSAGESYPIQKLQLENKQLENLVAERTLELKNAIEKIEKIASTDYLTGILNRRKFEKVLLSYINNKSAGTFCVAIFDIDNFKSINDTYGHMKGDTIIKFISDIINSSINDSDIFARWGGEEFMLLLPNSTIENSTAKIESILNNIRNSKSEINTKITISCGLSKYSINDNLEALVMRVDKALYTAKNNGKDRLEIL